MGKFEDNLEQILSHFLQHIQEAMLSLQRQEFLVSVIS